MPRRFFLLSDAVDVAQRRRLMCILMHIGVRASRWCRCQCFDTSFCYRLILILHRVVVALAMHVACALPMLLLMVHLSTVLGRPLLLFGPFTFTRCRLFIALVFKRLISILHLSMVLLTILIIIFDFTCRQRFNRYPNKTAKLQPRAYIIILINS